MIYIFTGDDFKVTELFNNQFMEDLSYKQLKEKTNITFIDNVIDKKKFINKGFETDDIILCVNAPSSYQQLKANLYFVTDDWSNFINYVNYIKINLWKEDPI